MYDPTEREAMTALLADDLWTPTLDTAGREVERWRSPGGGHFVEFPVHGDTRAYVYEGISGAVTLGTRLGVADNAAELGELLP